MVDLTPLTEAAAKPYESYKRRRAANAEDGEFSDYVLPRPELHPVALHGILGEMVDAACANSEAVPSTVILDGDTRSASAVLGAPAYLSGLTPEMQQVLTDGGREARVMELCREFLSLPADKMPAWLKDGVQMRDAGIVPRKYLQQRTQRIAAFEKFNLGHTHALNMAIKTAMTNGNLMEVKKDSLIEQFGFHGQAYRVLSLT